MVRRDPTDLLTEILEGITDISGYAKGLEHETFDQLLVNDRKTYRAVKNALSEIGEAIKNLPQDVTNRHPTVDWRGASKLRDIIAHHYHRLDTQQLWLVITDDFPALLSAVEAELNATPPAT